MKNIKYVECRHTALVRCKYTAEGGEKTTIDFYPFTINKYTGQPATTGFTQISGDVLALLEKESRVFSAFVKQGLLIVCDELPSSAMTPQAIIVSKDQKIAELQAQLAGVKPGCVYTEEEMDAVKSQLADANERIAALERQQKSKKNQASEAEGKTAQF